MKTKSGLGNRFQDIQVLLMKTISFNDSPTPLVLFRIAGGLGLWIMFCWCNTAAAQTSSGETRSSRSYLVQEVDEKPPGSEPGMKRQDENDRQGVEPAERNGGERESEEWEEPERNGGPRVNR